jgi:enoyl-CoA hydratase/carnithine racemase
VADYSQFKHLEVALADGVLTVVLNRPEVRNAFNKRMKREWIELLDLAEDDPEVKVVTVRGAGTVFSAGGDIKEGAPGYVAEGVSSSLPKHDIPSLPRAWYFRKALVAGVHGYVGPAACAFLGPFDFVIAAENTRFSFEIIRMGGEGTTSTILSMQLPMRVMKKLYLMGGWFDEQQALNWDFVQRVVPGDQLADEIHRWGVELTKIVPGQIKAGKETLHRIYELMGLINIAAVSNRSSGHGAETNREFYRVLLEQGMRAALKLKDSGFDPALAKV